ncbi:MAG: hypothetical protein AB7O96_02200 [Pseudobdellovibrionaceae bacterium]
MIRVIVILTILLSIGCATTSPLLPLKNPDAGTAEPNPDFNYDNFLNNLDSTNRKIRADLLLNPKMGKKLTTVNLAVYSEKLESYKSTIPNELKNDLKYFEIQTVQGHAKTFVMCGFSQTLKLSFCDDSKCMGIEKKLQGSENKVSELAVDLPSKNCISDKMR